MSMNNKQKVKKEIRYLTSLNIEEYKSACRLKMYKIH